MAVETFFIIAVNDDGSLTSHTQWPDEPIVPQRFATTYDIFQSSKQIVDEFEQQVLAERIAKMVAAQLTVKEAPSVPDRLKDALKERGIDPESIAPTA